HHGRRWCPRRIDPLVGDAGHALPTALLARDGDRIAERLPGLRNVVEPTITEADDDLAPGVLRTEAHNFATTAANQAAATPIPEQLGGCRRGAKAGRCCGGSRGHGDPA